MAVKRFVAPDMRRALDLVRQEMGPDAIILSSKRVPDGVEVLTAQELDLPTRGYDTRKEFGQRFDAEHDRPLASDQAWKPQATPPAVPQSYAAPAVNETAARASKLAAEIEAARERMMAAKRSADAAHRAIGEPQPTLQQNRPSRIEPRFDEYAMAGLEAVPVARAEPQVATAPRAFSQLDQPFAARPQQDRQLAGLAAQVEKMRAQTPPEVDHRDPRHEQRLNDLQHEVADMRSLLEQHLQRVTQPSVGRDTQRAHLPPIEPTQPKVSINHAALSQHLTRLGLPAEVCDPLCNQFGAEPRLNIAWRDALNELVGQVPVNAADCIDKGGVFAFVGPTGVGKTTSIAKLAARYVLTHGQGKVALVTTDTYRVGAQDQLRSLGRILNVPVRVIDQERSLPAVLASLKAFPLVLIDTAGFRQGDPLLKEQEAMLANCDNVQRILVMAGNSQLQTLKASAHAYKSRRLTGCILTKIDETLSLGEAISVLIQQSIPLLYTTDGQEIPKDIAIASGHHLVAKAISLTKTQERTSQELQGTSGR